ncbi:MAG: hypothetical protein MR675_05480 [Lachnospira sp.]|nr:hypothetical protein [Lachnospira sp.]MDD5829033.1 hypothetical protein [Lachnospira sp.]
MMKGVKKSYLKFIACIFIITIFFSGMCLDRVQACSGDNYAQSLQSVQDVLSNESVIIVTPEPSIDDSRPCTTEMLGNQVSYFVETIAVSSSVRSNIRLSDIMSDLQLTDSVNLYINAINIGSLNNEPQKFAVILNYIHEKDGKKQFS